MSYSRKLYSYFIRSNLIDFWLFFVLDLVLFDFVINSHCVLISNLSRLPIPYCFCTIVTRFIPTIPHITRRSGISLRTWRQTRTTFNRGKPSSCVGFRLSVYLFVDVRPKNVSTLSYSSNWVVSLVVGP